MSYFPISVFSYEQKLVNHKNIANQLFELLGILKQTLKYIYVSKMIF